MDEQSREIIKAMIEMAWADGHASPEESGLLIRAFSEAGAGTEELETLHRLLERSDGIEPQEAAHIDPSGLDEEKRLGVMRALLIVSFMDGHVSFAEYAQIERWQATLEVTPEQMEVLRSEALAAAETLAAS